MLLLPLTWQLAWQTAQMGKQFAHGQQFDQPLDPACLPVLPGAQQGAAEGLKSLQWGIHRTNLHCRHKAIPSVWWFAFEPGGPEFGTRTHNSLSS